MLSLEIRQEFLLQDLRSIEWVYNCVTDRSRIRKDLVVISAL